ncbi:MAG: S8 family peptidase [Alloprevotella sp.]|nr:S8 family peptidase [Alloprevotella sp.]
MWKKSLVMSVLALAGCMVANAQKPLIYGQKKLDYQLERFVEQQEKYEFSTQGGRRMQIKSVASPDETISLTINAANAHKLTKQLEKKGYSVLEITENVLVAELPASEISALVDDDNVYYMKGPRQFYPLTKITREKTKVGLVHEGRNLETPFDGTGVVVGIIDQGFEFRHPAFMDENNKTRGVRYLNHQNGNVNASASATIPSGSDNFGGSHATHVTGIAAGSKIDGVDYYGMAPKADIFFVPSNFSDNAIIAAIKKIKDYASSEGKPAVVNMSFGATVGPHDGTTLYDRTVDGLIQEGGVFVAAAMGNERGENIHATYKFTGGETKYLKLKTIDSSYAIYQMQIWCTSVANGTQPLTITPVYFKENTVKEFSAEGLTEIRRYMSSGVDQYNQKQYLEAWPTQSQLKSASGETGTANLYLGFKITGPANSEFHAWSSSGYTEFFSGGANVITPNDEYIVGEGAASIPSAFAVAAYVGTKTMKDENNSNWSYNTVGEPNYIANFSSRGPWFGQEAKPMVAAPGTVILSSLNRDDNSVPSSYKIAKRLTVGGVQEFYGPMSGTSMATPVVTGTIALWLQANPNLTYDEIKTIFKQTSIRDSYTGTASATNFDVSWGYGKLDAYEGIKKALSFRTHSDNQGASNTETPVSLLTEEDAMRVLFNNGESYANIRVYTLDGKQIMSRRLLELQAGNEEVVSYHGLNQGVYLINIQTTRSNITRKIVVR